MKIGIFWYFNHQVIGIAHEFQTSQQDSLGLIDSHYTHVKYWKILQHTYSELKFLEYDEIPRGRVLFNARHQKMMVYMDAKLFKKSISTQIVQFFELALENVVWKKDPHYKT